MSGQQLLDAFPQSAIELLSGSGRAFIRRIGEHAAKEAVLGVLRGENLRSQTEHLTRARISQLSAAVVAQYVTASASTPDFPGRFFEIAKDAISRSNRTHPAYLSAQWFLGLTGKSVQNVLRGNSENLSEYVDRFSEVLEESACRVRESLGEYRVHIESPGQQAALDWARVLQLTTAIGAQALTIRGSDKSMYGKLFERLVLGSVLSMLGFHLVAGSKPRSVMDVGAFWLSDSDDTRECDATAVIAAGKIARFDIGFIGPGNSEISKDKLSRFSAEGEFRGAKAYSRTFIVVDRLPNTSKTRDAAKRINAEIVQMSMKFWTIELAKKLAAIGWQSDMATAREDQITDWLENRMADISLLPLIGDFELVADPDAATSD